MADGPTATTRRKQAVLQRLSTGKPADGDDGPGPGFVAVPALVPAAPVRRAATGLDPLGGTQAEPEIVSALDRMRGKGSRLPTPVAQPLGDALGADFGDVRIHADPAAHSMTTALQARAFTHGSDIYFSAGSYAPHTTAGHHLLSHELAHVVQSRSETGSGSGTVVGRADDHAEVQAESVAHRISRMISGATPVPALPAAGPRQGVSRIARMIRRAGDKLAFEPKTAEDGADKQLVDKIKDAIEAHQQAKRTYKNTIEKDKDDKIAAVDTKGLNEGAARNQKVAELKKYHEVYKKSGWKLDKLKEEILTATGNQVEFGPEVDGEIPVLSRKTTAQLYSIFTGAKRFGTQVSEEDGKALANPAHIKKGTEKQYVQDKRGLFVGRFVFRGCNPEQMKELFTTGVMKPRYDVDEIGRHFTKFDFGGRNADAKITEEEREFLQQRDGSGDDQRMLSVTHAKPTRKVHSNHGEEFRGKEADSAVIQVDMSKVDKKYIADVHLEASHEFKVGLPNKTRDKSTAQKEKGLYIYSSERNRETLLRQIPEAAVTSVKITSVPKPMSTYLAKRFYNPEFNKQELEREEKERVEKEAAEAKLASTVSVGATGENPGATGEKGSATGENKDSS